MFSTCFYTSFLSRDFLSFCTDSLYTCSYSHWPLHTRHLFAEVAYQITQVPRVFDTRFLPFYTTCAIRYTCRPRTLLPKNNIREVSSQNTTPFNMKNANANLGELTHIQGILLPKLHTRISKHFGHLKIIVFFLPTKMHTCTAKYLGHHNVCTYSSILLPKISRNTMKAIFATY